MEATPDTPGGFGCAFYGTSFEGRYLCTGSVEEKLDFFLDGGNLEVFEGNDLVAVVDVKSADDGFLLVSLLEDEFDMGVCVGESLDMGENEGAGWG